jgi:sortase A
MSNLLLRYSRSWANLFLGIEPFSAQVCRALVLVVSGLLLMIAGAFLADAALIYGKARLAPVLIKSAWIESLQTGQPVRPWPWADTWPVARLQVPELGVDEYVLAGSNGASLPFGPGHLSGSASPGGLGTVIVAAHRDTHFSFVPQLQPGHELQLQSIDGMTTSYRIVGQSVIDARSHLLEADPYIDQLILVTCEPTELLPYRGPWRRVAVASLAADGFINAISYGEIR